MDTMAAFKTQSLKEMPQMCLKQIIEKTFSGAVDFLADSILG